MSGVEIRFTTRSLAGMYSYIGSIVRAELGLDQPVTAVVTTDKERPPFYLFNIKTGTPGLIDVATEFGGTSYFISTDPSGFDASSEVLQILSTLQALNSKASALPAPNVSILAR